MAADPSSAPAALYRPLPEGPSPRWRRAADGLRLVRVALLVQLAFAALSRVARGVGEVQLYRRSAPAHEVQVYFMGAGLLHWGVVLGSVLIAVGLWSFAQAPASTRVSGLAKGALWVEVAGVAYAVLSFVAVFALARSAGLSATRIGTVYAALSLVAIALHGAWLVLLVGALDRARRAAGDALPGWAWALVAGTLVWHVAGLAGSMVQSLLAGSVPGAAWALLALGVAVSAGLTLGLARLVRLAEHSLARQEAPASAVG